MGAGAGAAAVRAAVAGCANRSANGSAVKEAAGGATDDDGGGGGAEKGTAGKAPSAGKGGDGVVTGMAEKSSDNRSISGADTAALSLAGATGRGAEDGCDVKSPNTSSSSS